MRVSRDLALLVLHLLVRTPGAATIEAATWVCPRDEHWRDIVPLLAQAQAEQNASACVRLDTMEESDGRVEHVGLIVGRRLGQRRGKGKGKGKGGGGGRRRRATNDQEAEESVPSSSQLSSCADTSRVSARSALLKKVLAPLPTREVLASRAKKLALLEQTKQKPNFLQLLMDANLMKTAGSRRLYFNLGARGVRDGSSKFFERYPGAKDFEHHAFEALPKAAREQYASMNWEAAMETDRRIHFHNVAVWNVNTTLTFGERRSASHVVGTAANSGSDARSVYGSDRKVRSQTSIPAIDFAEFVRTHATPDDFVLVKMDIEGAEFVVVPELIASGAACLIDELYLECHSGDVSDIAKGRTFAECITMLVALRGMGVAAQLWF